MLPEKRLCHSKIILSLTVDQPSPSLSHIGPFGQPYLHRSPKSGVRQSLSPPLPSSAVGCMAMSARFLRTSAEKRGSADVSSEEGAEGLATRHYRRLLLNRHAARTSLAHSTPRMLCVNTHYPTGPSWAKRPPRSASPTDVGRSLRKPLETTHTTRSRADNQAWHEFSTHFNALSSATIGFLFLRKMLSLRSGS